MITYRIYTRQNLADTSRDPDNIIIRELGYKSDLKTAMVVTNTYIKSNFFHENTKLRKNKDDSYSATDFCSYGETIYLQPIKIL